MKGASKGSLAPVARRANLELLDLQDLRGLPVTRASKVPLERLVTEVNAAPRGQLGLRDRQARRGQPDLLGRRDLPVKRELPHLVHRRLPERRSNSFELQRAGAVCGSGDAVAPRPLRAPMPDLFPAAGRSGALG